MQERTKVFISYSHQDQEWLNRLSIHLRPLERDHGIEFWDDRKIAAGLKWREEIEKAIGSAKVAVLLISASFLASDFIAKDELPPLLDAAEKEGATILPVIISASRFSKTGNLCQFQAVNDPRTPLCDLPWGEQEAVLEKVSEAIEAALQRSPNSQTLLLEKDSRKETLPRLAQDHSTARKHTPRGFSKRSPFVWIIGAVVILPVLAWLIYYANTSANIKAESKAGLSRETTRVYFDYITLAPMDKPTHNTNCLVTHHVALRFEVPEGQKAVYRGRVKSRDGTALDSNPSFELLNTTEWNGNPSLLEFSIEEKPVGSSTLDIEAVAYSDTMVTIDGAKVASHFPYFTEYAVVTFDYSRMKFTDPLRNLRARLEFRGPRGEFQTENLTPIPHLGIEDKTITVMHRNLPADSNIVLRWGDQQ